MAAPNGATLHDPDEYDTFVRGVADDVETELANDPHASGAEPVLDWVVESNTLDADCDTAAFIAMNSTSEPDDYTPFVTPGEATSVINAMAYVQLRADVASRLRSRGVDV